MKYLLVSLLLISVNAYSQIKMPGQVVDANNNPIGLATINVVGKAAYATTDDSGFFYLSFPNDIKKGDDITLRIAKTGYRTNTKQVPVSLIVTVFKLQKSTATKAPYKPVVIKESVENGNGIILKNVIIAGFDNGIVGGNATPPVNGVGITSDGKVKIILDSCMVLKNALPIKKQ